MRRPLTYEPRIWRGFFVFMWVRFIKEIDGARVGDTVWTDDDDAGQNLINIGSVVRVTGPDSAGWNETPPEDYIDAISKEEDLTFREAELVVKYDKNEITEAEVSAEAQKHGLEEGKLSSKLSGLEKPVKEDPKEDPKEEPKEEGDIKEAIEDVVIEK